MLSLEDLLCAVDDFCQQCDRTQFINFPLDLLHLADSNKLEAE
ncbi:MULTISPECIES: hypothetical protein [Trichocoleus]|nr:hypothetical protein [Trichocoleus sp. FACHB-46]